MKIITVIGARPQFVKAATVSRAIRKFNQNNTKQIEEKIIHTGQHYDPNMSDIFFETMDIPKPHFYLGVGSVSHGAMTGRQLEKIEDIIITEKPDYLLVYGDTNSTLAGALAAAKLHIPVAHVEAGLRSFNMRMPEEINRILTDNISNILFCPTETAVNNLKVEGFSDKNCNIINVGDVMYDAAMCYSEKSFKPASLSCNLNEFILVTIHRADNTDEVARLSEIVNSLNELAKKMTVVFPVHPRTKKAIEDAGLKLEVDTLDPLSYFEMLWLLQNCKLVVTDSGGLQKEAYFFSKPCITLRDQTEWVELIEIGVNSLVEIKQNTILDRALSALKIKKSLFSNSALYGNADAAGKIVNVLANT
jgi:UDP-GlcNAc3NAcA epimerase